ncbi:MAG TPA: HAD family hydrolase [Gammaproteobacteria bacterium]|nr:HAD family hydrolase [Gammaproteobacteria bacterium]
MQNIRALTFDLDDTLWDNRSVMLAAEQSLYGWLGRHYPRIVLQFRLEDMWRLRQDLLQQHPGLRNDVTELRKTSLRAVADAAGYGHDLVEPAFAVFLEARHRITPYSDVVPVLQALRRAGYCLGSLTNGNADVQRLGLGHLFDFSLTAASVGKAKPHPRMFEEACRLAGVNAQELAHIGDEADTDIAGAHNAGVTAIWINREQLPARPEIACHAVITGMPELLALLGVDVP